MKKVVLAAAAVALMATPVMAETIVGSKHDLSSSGPNTIKSATLDRVCAFCHTPHNASMTVVLAPLWNRTTVKLAATDLYNSATLTATASPTAALAGFNASDAPLCLSCHDGTSVNSALVNDPTGSGFSTAPDVTAWSNQVNPNSLIADGTDMMKDDHPVGFNFSLAANDEVVSGDNGLNTAVEAASAGVKFFAGDMWCSSCHNVHKPGSTSSGTYPFLRTSNNASALCLACHAK